MLPTEELNIIVQRHEIMTKWEYREVAERLHEWFRIFNQTLFDNKLPVCFLQFEPEHRGRLGHYHKGRNGVGACHEINMNPLYFSRPFYQVLGTLLHEMVHEWQELFGTPSKGGWHNREFTQFCSRIGIPCTGGYSSVTQDYTEPFLSLLKHHGITAETRLTLEEKPYQSPGSKLKKWSCGCTNIWAAVEIEVICQQCQRPFQRIR